MYKKVTGTLGAFALLGSALLVAASASGSTTQSVRAGDSPDNPIIVASPDDVPDGAVQTGRTTHEDCSTTTTWRLTVPGTDETSHQEFRYTRDVPAVDGVTHQEWGSEERTRSKTENQVKEYRFQTRTPLFGQKEVKEIQGWNFVSGGTTTVQGQTVAGHWVQQAGSHVLPAVIVNIVWGPSGPPDSVLGHGTVNLNVYGGPNVVVNYYAYVVQTEEGFTDWGPWSDWSRNNPGAETETRNVETREVGDGTFTFGAWSDWTERSSGELSEPTLPANTDTREYRVTGPFTVTDVAPEDGFTEYFVLGDEPSRNADDASWVLSEQVPADQGWAQFDERTVVNQEGTPEVVTYYAYNDGYECPTVDDRTDDRDQDAGNDQGGQQQDDKRPSPEDRVPTVIDAGL